MSKALPWAVILFFSALFVSSWEAHEEFTDLRGDYLGQKPPGMIPEKFAPGIVSTPKSEFNAAFSPDGNYLFYSVTEAGRETILFMNRKGERWTAPQSAPFVSKQDDCDPYFSPDGKRLYFISTRPKKSDPASKDWDIYYVERKDPGWSEPKNIGPPVNSDHDEYYISLTKEGTIYFASDRRGSHGSHDIYRSKYVRGRYAQPENLGTAINSTCMEHDPFVAPDESYVVFTSVDRPGGFGSGDMYISFRSKDDSWSKARNLGKPFNTSGYDFCPIVTPDGKYFFFTQKGDIYWVKIDALLRK